MVGLIHVQNMLMNYFKHGSASTRRFHAKYITDMRVKLQNPNRCMANVMGLTEAFRLGISCLSKQTAFSCTRFSGLFKRTMVCRLNSSSSSF